MLQALKAVRKFFSVHSQSLRYSPTPLARCSSLGLNKSTRSVIHFSYKKLHSEKTHPCTVVGYFVIAVAPNHAFHEGLFEKVTKYVTICDFCSPFSPLNGTPNEMFPEHIFIYMYEIDLAPVSKTSRFSFPAAWDADSVMSRPVDKLKPQLRERSETGTKK